MVPPGPPAAFAEGDAATERPDSRGLPCRHNPDLWFAEKPTELERAKSFCVDCPIKTECLAGALARAEPWGVWGGEILERGVVVARKRSRGRPPKNHSPVASLSAAKVA
jgi:WhiB family redox-sensing transcriptional regulator